MCTQCTGICLCSCGTCLTSSGLELDLLSSLDLSYIFEVHLPPPMGTIYHVSLVYSEIFNQHTMYRNLFMFMWNMFNHGRWEMNLQNITQV